MVGPVGATWQIEALLFLSAKAGSKALLGRVMSEEGEAASQS